ncbi:PREDICTED: uncharacterized protein LOC104588162 [Nelumbo nucifera]|uniref:Uncharacterized protein LOC104588162 n=2 Tax=Nelumbo nucifera TaxID=4432 RepID=A0A1U7YXN7_NELNU|nr:PREDICTED: uncharacterized protein LOC104588162 [Nelumbo nucifera]DAD21707.1 TPA_asm: hypothetical protein HUJ06_023170 [Nelumbo nucifera]
MEASRVLLLSPAAVVPPPLRRQSCNLACRRTGRRASLKVVAMAEESSGSGDGIIEKAAIVGGLVSAPVIGWSLYTLKTSGCGLPPGPGGSIGALEGISYLVVVGIVAWSLYTKARTGSGLPNGPYGLLGAVEGLSYLALLGILVVFGLQFLDKGFIPGPLPGDQCFG